RRSATAFMMRSFRWVGGCRLGAPPPGAIITRNSPDRKGRAAPAMERPLQSGPAPARATGIGSSFSPTIIACRRPPPGPRGGTGRGGGHEGPASMQTRDSNHGPAGAAPHPDRREFGRMALTGALGAAALVAGTKPSPAAVASAGADAAPRA